MINYFIKEKTVCLVQKKNGHVFMGIFHCWDEHGFVIVNSSSVAGSPVDISEKLFSFDGQYTTSEDIEYELSKPQTMSVFKDYETIHFTNIPAQLYRDKIGIAEVPIME